VPTVTYYGVATGSVAVLSPIKLVGCRLQPG